MAGYWSLRETPLSCIVGPKVKEPNFEQRGGRRVQERGHYRAQLDGQITGLFFNNSVIHIVYTIAK